MQPSENKPVQVTLSAGVVVVDPAGRLLVVLRRNEPSAGRWSLPGGRVEAGEEPAAAAAREAYEETGLRVAIGRRLGGAEQRYVDGSGDLRILDIHDFAGVVTGGSLRPGDDALDARWMTLAQLTEMPLTPDLLTALREFGVVLQ